ncbi:MAG: hypothetical protein B6D41_12865, partial [Chloroflexi bacterium UTCFX4]
SSGGFVATTSLTRRASQFFSVKKNEFKFGRALIFSRDAARLSARVNVKKTPHNFCAAFSLMTK